MKLRMVLCIAALTLMGCFCLPSWAATLLMTPPEIDPPPADPARGQEIFTKGLNGSPPCISCHQVIGTSFGFALGPSLIGIHSRAATRIEGMSAEAYITNSILHPADFVVPGYRNIMYPKFANHFSDQDMADLVAYLMTL
jgi:mono/diheme cytochrome c family protein